MKYRQMGHHGQYHRGEDSFWSPTFLMALECKGFADLDRDGKLDLWYLRYATDQEFQCTDGLCFPVYPLEVALVERSQNKTAIVTP